ncbi:MAG: hypothetical protein PHE17_19245 [Thiothrix sp.]|jgi:phage gpG-like protein|uniref:hypothetical protein n=1 Tax=Thiothrix sp. TaxID=1032 RepID=UPI00261B9EF1|nr:hypothetical protein [Thiothrix sp.]MDD5395163.1 hypothetical protein [Thiothrix sp.]
MTISLAIDASGINKIAEKMAMINANPEPLLLIAIQVGQTSVHRNFVALGRPTPWAPRKPLTEKILENRYGYVKGVLLRVTSHLMAATGLGGQVGADGVLRVEGNTAYLVNNTPYAAKLHYGDPGGEPYVETVKQHQRISPKGNVYTVKAHQRNAITRPIPPRPFMMWQKEDGEDVAAYCRSYLIKTLSFDTH